MGLKEARTDRPEGQSSFKEGLCEHLTLTHSLLSSVTASVDMCYQVITLRQTKKDCPSIDHLITYTLVQYRAEKHLLLVELDPILLFAFFFFKKRRKERNISVRSHVSVLPTFESPPVVSFIIHVNITIQPNFGFRHTSSVAG